MMMCVYAYRIYWSSGKIHESYVFWSEPMVEQLGVVKGLIILVKAPWCQGNNVSLVG